MLNLASLLRLLTGDLLGNADCVNNNNNNIAPTLQFSLTALLNLRSLALKRSALSGSDLNCGRTNPTIAYTVSYPNLKKYLSNSAENLLRPIFDENKLLYCKRKWAYNIGKFHKRLTPRELGSIYVLQIISKLDEVPTRELSSYIKTELYLRKFYCLVITGEDTHYKQIIKKAYIMSLERALLILFMT
ncbi:hypothetical protein HBI83_129730 [Parastagonospora nodorum]|nr:hypothetical protein HBI83_129730 [Parastagonospora nodorum]